MAGPHLGVEEQRALESWLFAIPAPAPSPGELGAVARGQALFTDPVVGCSSCHAGARLTVTVDVGAGGAFQVPSLPT